MSRTPDVQTFVQLLRRVSLFFMRAAAEGADSHAALSKQEMLALAVLRDAAPCRMGDLAEALGVVQSAVTPLVDRLEDRGLALRERSAEDRRVWLVNLTAAGLDVVRADDAAYERMAEGMLAPLEPDEQKELIRLMSRIAGEL